MAGFVPDFGDFELANEVLTPAEHEIIKNHVFSANQNTLSPEQLEKLLQDYKKALIAFRHPGIRISNKTLHIPDQIPISPGTTAPFNRWFARSNLFSPMKSGNRKEHQTLKLNSPEGATLIYTGEELDIYDLDVYLTAMKIAAGSVPGKRIRVSRNEFLRSMGLNTKRFSGVDYNVLGSSFSRLSKGLVYISVASNRDPNLRIQGSTHLLSDLYVNSNREYCFEVPRTSLILYAEGLFCHVDLARRRELPRKSYLARRLQTYVASYGGGEYRVELGGLQAWMGYRAKPYMFKVRCDKAFGELIDIGELRWAHFEKCGGRLENGVFVWEGNPDVTHETRV